MKIESIQEQYRYRAICHSTPEFSKETTFGYDIYEGIFEKTGGNEATLNGFPWSLIFCLETVYSLCNISKLKK